VHIHFFVSAPSYRQLTTQINIAGDEYLYEDFAFATWGELISAVTRDQDSAAARQYGLNGPSTEIDFALNRETG